VWAWNVVEHIGRNKVLAQPWELVESAGDFGLVLTASTDPPDRGHLDLLERIAQIKEGLGLDALQHAAARKDTIPST
jgi:hypothetical protein